MTIQEAINSGKKFRRQGDTLWQHPLCLGNFKPSLKDVLATDWEIAEELPLVLDHKKLNCIKAELEGYCEKQEFPLFSSETARLFNELIRLAHLGLELKRERERSRKLVEALEKYTKHSTCKGAAVGDYVPCRIVFEAIAKYEKSIGDN